MKNEVLSVLAALFAPVLMDARNILRNCLR